VVDEIVKHFSGERSNTFKSFSFYLVKASVAVKKEHNI